MCNFFIAGKFQFFDYGITENKKKYGQPMPPLYNMEKITTPIALFYAQNDWLAGPEVRLFKMFKTIFTCNQLKISFLFNRMFHYYLRNCIDRLLVLIKFHSIDSIMLIFCGEKMRQPLCILNFLKLWKDICNFTYTLYEQ